MKSVYRAACPSPRAGAPNALASEAGLDGWGKGATAPDAQGRCGQASPSAETSGSLFLPAEPPPQVEPHRAHLPVVTTWDQGFSRADGETHSGWEHFGEGGDSGTRAQQEPLV